MPPLQQLASEERVDEESYSIQDVVEGLGFGVGQVTLMLMAFGGYFLEGLLFTLLGAMAPTIASENHFRSTGAWSTSLMTGAFVGEAVCGVIAHKTGLSQLLLTGYAILTFFIMFISFSDWEDWFLESQFMLGLGMGLSQVSALALLYELLPDRWRLQSIAASIAFYGIGFLIGIVTLVTTGMPLESESPDPAWRFQIRFCAIPAAFLFLFGSIYIPESPHWLALTGDFAGARDVLHRLRYLNNVEQVSPLFKAVPNQADAKRAKALAMEHSMLGFCSTSAMTCFAARGVILMLPNLLKDWHYEAKSEIPQNQVMLWGAVFTGILLLLATVFFPPVNTKVSLLASIMSTGAASAVFFFLAIFGSPLWQGEIIAPLISSCCIMAFPVLVEIFSIKASMEMLPVSSTVVGAALTKCAGRLGTLAFPLVQHEASPVSETGFFGLVSVLCLMCIMLIGPAQHLLYDPPRNFVFYKDDALMSGSSGIFRRALYDNAGKREVPLIPMKTP